MHLGSIKKAPFGGYTHDPFGHIEFLYVLLVNCRRCSGNLFFRFVGRLNDFHRGFPQLGHHFFHNSFLSILGYASLKCRQHQLFLVS